MSKLDYVYVLVKGADWFAFPVAEPTNTWCDERGIYASAAFGTEEDARTVAESLSKRDGVPNAWRVLRFKLDSVSEC